MEFFVSTLLFGISVGGQYALIAIGYTMVYGILRLINFAHGDVFMVAGLLGIYLSSFLSAYLPPAVPESGISQRAALTERSAGSPAPRRRRWWSA